MTPAEAKPAASDAISEAEIDEAIAEFGGDIRALTRALLEDQAVLIRDAQEACSRGFLRGRFADSARRAQADDEP